MWPALGYYEREQTDHGKVPYFLHHPDDTLLAFAGLYELRRDPTLPDDDPNRRLWTCTIITQPATYLLGTSMTAARSSCHAELDEPLAGEQERIHLSPLRPDADGALLWRVV